MKCFGFVQICCPCWTMKRCFGVNTLTTQRGHTHFLCVSVSVGVATLRVKQQKQQEHSLQLVSSSAAFTLLWFLPPLGFIRSASSSGNYPLETQFSRAERGTFAPGGTMLYFWIHTVWIPGIAFLFGFQGKGSFHSFFISWIPLENTGVERKIAVDVYCSCDCPPLTRVVEVCEVTSLPVNTWQERGESSWLSLWPELTAVFMDSSSVWHREESSW